MTAESREMIRKLAQAMAPNDATLVTILESVYKLGAMEMRNEAARVAAAGGGRGHVARKIELLEP